MIPFPSPCLSVIKTSHSQIVGLHYIPSGGGEWIIFNYLQVKGLEKQNGISGFESILRGSYFLLL